MKPKAINFVLLHSVICFRVRKPSTAKITQVTICLHSPQDVDCYFEPNIDADSYSLPFGGGLFLSNSRKTPGFMQ